MNEHLSRLVERYPILESCAPSIETARQMLQASFENGGRLLLCGNGGSASDCEHIAGELMKSFLRPRPLPTAFVDELRSMGTDGERLAESLEGALPCIALTGHPALQFAISNDVRAEMVFAQSVYALGKPGDVLWGISTSGNSRNVVFAFHVARLRGVKTFALTGQDGGDLARLADCVVRVPASVVDEIQELHLPVYHALCAALEAHFFPASP